MIIKELHIYGYGKLHNVSFGGLGQLQIFYGPNEAGKSTIRSFIHSILFGFPLKNQNENRYEPKSFPAYGGRLVIGTEKYGDVTIQRMKGKAAGDVTVLFADGRQGTEEDLKSILRGMDKQTFQSIYSFDLDGISQLSQVNEADISRYLLSAGLVGSDALMRAEQKLQKEMDAYYKPSGRNPKLNSRLSQMDTDYGSLRQALEEQDQYNKLVDSYQHCKAEMDEIDQSMKALDQEIACCSSYLSMKPLLLEKKQLEDRLEELGGIEMPLDAEERLYSINQALTPVTASVASIKSQLESMKRKSEEVVLNEPLQNNLDSVERALDKASSIETMEVSLYEAKQKLSQKNREIEELKHYAHPDLQEQNLPEMNTSLARKEEIVQLSERYKKLLQVKERLEEQQDGIQAELNTADVKMKSLQDELLPEAARQRLEQQEVNRRDKEYMERESVSIKKIISDLEGRLQAAIKKEKEEKERKRLISRTLTIMIAAAFIFSVIRQEWLLLLVIVAFGAGSLILAKMAGSSSSVPELQRELEEWKSKQSKMGRGQQGGPSHEEAVNASYILERDDEIRQLIRHEEWRKKDLMASFSKTIAAFEEWERESLEAEAHCERILSDWGLSSAAAEHTPLSLPGLYETLISLKKCMYEQSHLLKEWEVLNERLSEMKSSLIGLCGQYTSIGTDSWQEAQKALKDALRTEESNSLRKRQYDDSIRTLTNQLEEQVLKEKHLKTMLNELFKESGCQEEQEFLLKLNDWKEMKELKGRLQTVKLQLEPYHGIQLPEDEAFVSEYSIQSLKEKKEEYKQRYNELIRAAAEINQQIKQLEEGGRYEDLYFRFQAEKSALQEEAKEWFKLAMAKHMLNKVIQDYRNKVLPGLLEKAEEYVRRITEGAYERLFWSEEDGKLLLQREDGQVFHAGEVSRGTQEAVYISLRLALAGKSLSEESMPLIIDDSFVNLDHRRTAKLLPLLKEMKQQQQILFFTCHEHFVDAFDTNSVIRLQQPVLGK